MVTFRLYSEEYPQGLVLAKIIANGEPIFVFTSYLKRVYSNGRFRVTIQYPHKKEETIVYRDE